MSGFALSYTANMFILVIMNDLYLLAVESRVQIADWCAPWKISNGAENFVLQALQF
jgi:hypothetical protein